MFYLNPIICFLDDGYATTSQKRAGKYKPTAERSNSIPSPISC